ncbi:ankyrin repeat protein, putative [Trichomonas vaginalis G3]|uniref:Ankyrin repeat protein, putative n=1 Tax=Trichomonas vaginalis (strain ATCC PRA-98 / G3) TaxID=412133 RepID=A2DAC0_TRIV3|nr:protein ubiquitination [Trichomonas vaginalis G3]EAY22768.1 ankyrin repeat protein, putative [Trichomonas vaginalis G3]KAI5525579.1 protein ubiquitination [Trichomonas vaginalis G3]|eukprot:XP_001583754.1 ankyrin repeat protein [Trichomonas vaginalis G3]
MEENTIYSSIMRDDIKSFISFTEREGFDENIKLKREIFPFSWNGFTLLELCCYYGSDDCFKFLRTKFNSKITYTCLCFSFLSGRPEIMNKCLKSIKPDQSCMKWAIISHNIDFVEFLMNEHHIGIKLEYCCRYNNLQAFFVYLDQTNDIDNCFMFSPSFGIQDLCQYLLSKGANILNSTKPVYKLVGSYTNEDIIDERSVVGYDITQTNNNEWTALHCAAQYDHKDIAEFHVTNGADVNFKDNFGRTVLYYAAFWNSLETAKFLLAHGLKLAENKAVLNVAVERNSKEMIEFLLSKGVSINSKNEFKKTSIIIAAEYNFINALKLLVLNGADVNSTDEDGETALHYASLRNHKDIVEFLLLNGAKINIVNNFGDTALHYAAF